MKRGHTLTAFGCLIGFCHRVYNTLDRRPKRPSTVTLLRTLSRETPMRHFFHCEGVDKDFFEISDVSADPSLDKVFPSLCRLFASILGDFPLHIHCWGWSEKEFLSSSLVCCLSRRLKKKKDQLPRQMLIS